MHARAGGNGDAEIRYRTGYHGAGKLPSQELQAIAQKSCAVLHGMGPKIQWVQSYVTDDKIYCVYVAPDEVTVKMHAETGGFPANVVARVRSVIDPTTAE